MSEGVRQALMKPVGIKSRLKFPIGLDTDLVPNEKFESNVEDNSIC